MFETWDAQASACVPAAQAAAQRALDLYTARHPEWWSAEDDDAWTSVRGGVSTPTTRQSDRQRSTRTHAVEGYNRGMRSHPPILIPSELVCVEEVAEPSGSAASDDVWRAAVNAATVHGHHDATHAECGETAGDSGFTCA
ncbi:hypothetical protein EON66_11940 [archaeon]|nr:MAG: hypothetical protein EON66_11940 [archaeon]